MPLSPSELMDPIGDCGVLRGGLCDGSTTRRTLARSLGANTFADLRIDCAASAFRLDRLRLERLDSGDCAAAVVASCAVPGLFAPQRLPSGLYADFAVLLDPCGEFALPSLPPSGRLLSLVAGDWNPRCWAEATPSRLPGRLGGDAVVVSLRVSGVSRVWPWAIRRLGARAHREAYLAVSAALDRPLGAGREPRHFRVEAVPARGVARRSNVVSCKPRRSCFEIRALAACKTLERKSCFSRSQSPIAELLPPLDADTQLPEQALPWSRPAGKPVEPGSVKSASTPL